MASHEWTNHSIAPPPKGQTSPQAPLDRHRHPRHRAYLMDRPEITFAGELDQVLVVAAPAALDHAAADPLRQAVSDNLPDREDACVILDLQEVELITSIGIAALLEIRELCADRRAPPATGRPP